MRKVRMYWNLHKGIWSVQDCKTGRVIDHVIAMTLADAKFVVRKAGQERVRREGKKNVHAFAVGHISLKNGLATLSGRKVSYNPYKNDTFVFTDTGEPVTDAYAISLATTSEGKPVVYATLNPNRPSLDTFNQQ